MVSTATLRLRNGISTLASALFFMGMYMGACLSAGHALELGLPLQCELGKTCWVVNFVDLDPGKGVRDHACTAYSYDGHKGTDFAIRDLKAMEAGVPVIAAAPGTVKAVRDGMADVDVNERGKLSVSGRECGNGVVISHEQGWETQYCHLKKGSISVRQGDVVPRGQQLGLVGHSGLAQFPHVHLSVRNEKKVIDPFISASPGGECGDGSGPLWQAGLAAEMAAPPSAIFNAGFAAKAPRPKAIRAGLYKDKVLSRQAPALVLWADIYWPLVGDQLQMRIFGPDGDLIFEHISNIPKTQARRLFFAGKKRKSLFWPTGDYRGEITLVRRDSSGPGLTIGQMRRVTLK